VVDTWNTLNDIEYERLASSMVNSRINEDKAIVVYDVKIKTAAGETGQKEIYFLVKENEKWFIDDLIVTDEEVDLGKLEL
jgi:predicted enzyme involved in methoxymalonyl-ACP biosynthesis